MVALGDPFLSAHSIPSPMTTPRSKLVDVSQLIEWYRYVSKKEI